MGQDDMTTVDGLGRRDKRIGLGEREVDVEYLSEIIPKLKESQERLASMTIKERFEIIKEMADKWSDPNYSFRRDLIPKLAEETGYSAKMIEFLVFSSFDQIADMDKLFDVDIEDLKGCFKKFTPVPGLDNLLLRANTDDLSIKDKLRLIKNDYSMDSLLSQAPKLITSICAGNAPGLSVYQMEMALAVGAASIIKSSSDETLFGPAFLESMVEEGFGEITDSFALLHWPSEHDDITRYAIENSDAIILTGGPEAVSAVGKMIKEIGNNKGYDPHGHKAGISVISREFLEDESAARDLAIACGIDYTIWNQYACLSPRSMAVETGGKISPEKFSEMVVEGMIYVGKILGPSLDSKIHGERLLRDSLESDIKIKTNDSDFSYGIVRYDPTGFKFEPYSEACQNRTVSIGPIDDISDTIPILKNYSAELQTIVFAIPESRLYPYAEDLSKIGVSNIRPIGDAGFPQAGEPWDNRFIPFNLLNSPLSKIKWTSLNPNVDIKSAIDRLEAYK